MSGGERTLTSDSAIDALASMAQQGVLVYFSGEEVTSFGGGVTGEYRVTAERSGMRLFRVGSDIVGVIVALHDALAGAGEIAGAKR